MQQIKFNNSTYMKARLLIILIQNLKKQMIIKKLTTTNYNKVYNKQKTNNINISSRILMSNNHNKKLVLNQTYQNRINSKNKINNKINKIN